MDRAATSAMPCFRRSAGSGFCPAMSCLAKVRRHCCVRCPSSVPSTCGSTIASRRWAPLRPLRRRSYNVRMEGRTTAIPSCRTSHERVSSIRIPSMCQAELPPVRYWHGPPVATGKVWPWPCRYLVSVSGRSTVTSMRFGRTSCRISSRRSTPSSTLHSLRGLPPWALLSGRGWPSPPCPGRPVQSVGTRLIHTTMTAATPLLPGRVETFPGNLAAFAREGLVHDADGAQLILSNTAVGNRSYRSGSFASERAFGHGRFEAEIRAARGSGLVTGFSLHRDFPRQEIDVELTGDDPHRMLGQRLFQPWRRRSGGRVRLSRFALPNRTRVRCQPRFPSLRNRLETRLHLVVGRRPSLPRACRMGSHSNSAPSHASTR
jgi:hypothetical protein